MENKNLKLISWDIDSQELKTTDNINKLILFSSKPEKINSKHRIIDKPSYNYKEDFKLLYNIINELIELHPAVMGIRNTNIQQNAQSHIGAKYVLKLDIKNFFENTTRSKVLKAAVFDNNQKLTNILLATVKMWSVHRPKLLITGRYISSKEALLPTGAKTSPLLANYTLKELDYKIANKIQEYNGTYTRYLDDIIVSFKDDITQEQKNEIKTWLVKAIHDFGYQINTRKTKWLNPAHDKMIITGVDIRNNETRVNQTDIKNKWRPLINNNIQYYCQKILRDNPEVLLKNLNRHSFTFMKTIQKYIKEERPDWFKFLMFDQHVRGFLSYLQSVSQTQYKQILLYIEKRFSFYANLYFNKEDIENFGTLDKIKDKLKEYFNDNSNGKNFRPSSSSVDSGQKLSTDQDFDW